MNADQRYDEAVEWCQKIISSNHEMLYDLQTFESEIDKACERFDFPYETLNSLLRNIHVRHVKKTHFRLASLAKSIVNDMYIQKHKSILSIAKIIKIPSSMVARVVIEHVTDFTTLNARTKKDVHVLIRDDDPKKDNHHVEDEEEEQCEDDLVNSTGTQNEVRPIDGGKLPSSIQGTIRKITTQTATTLSNPTAAATTTTIRKTSSSRKAIMNALRDPMEYLSDIDIILPMYRSAIQVIAPFSSIHSYQKNHVDQRHEYESRRKYDVFTGLPFAASCCVPNNNSNTITTTRLAYDVCEALQNDPLYGPRHDRERNILGEEYELYLEQTLKSMNIPFETERDLRRKGTSRTPDILLSFPIAIKVPRINKKRDHDALTTTMSSINMRKDLVEHFHGKILHKDDGTLKSDLSQPAINDKKNDDREFDWKIICWIDSKALFGDEYTHRNSVLRQAEAYVHRFGPGLILYWFGHAPLHRLDNGHDVFVTGWNFPDFCLSPTGALQIGYT